MFRKIIHAISVVFFVVLFLVVLYSLTSRIMGETPSVFGYYFFRVSSDSMEPTLMVGDVILVHSANAEDIHKDDIITFKSKEGSMYGREVTHRVVLDPVVKKDKYYYQTQGDAPGAPLDKVITYDQIEGKFIRKLAIVGKLFNFFYTPTGIIVLIGVIVLLFGSEMIPLFFTSKKLEETDELLLDSLKKADSDKDEAKKDKDSDQSK